MGSSKSPARQKVYDYLLKHPGAVFSAIPVNCGISKSMLSVILKELKEEGMLDVSVTRPRRYTLIIGESAESVPEKPVDIQTEIPATEPEITQDVQPEIPATEPEPPVDVQTEIPATEPETTQDVQTEIPVTEPEPPAGIPVQKPSPEETRLEALFSTADSLLALMTGTEKDYPLQKAVEEIQRRISESAKPCIYCGRIPKLCGGDPGTYRMECTCGALIAFRSHTSSALETFRAYNRRASA